MNKMFEGKITNAEEIRVRCLVANRTGESSLTKNIHQMFQFAGLYPDKIQHIVKENGDFKVIDEFKTFEFFQYCEKFPDIKEVLVKHNLWSDIYESEKLTKLNENSGTFEIDIN